MRVESSQENDLLFGRLLATTERYPPQLREGPGYAERKVPEVRKQMAARMTGQ